jgi:hypothetical protein
MSKQSRRNRKPQGTVRATQVGQKPPAPKPLTASPQSAAEPSGPRSEAGAGRAQRRQAREVEEKRKRIIRTVIGVVGVVAILLAAWGGYRWWAGPDVSADVVTYFDVDTANAVHPEEDIVILYEQVPPVGGPHNAIWQTCGFYGETIFNWHGVHAMEHGAVWLTYDPELPQHQIDILRDKAEQGFVLVSPYPGLDAPVVGSVWGKQMMFDGVADDRIDAFIKQYRLNPNNTPEPGATCSGGATFTTDQVPQQNPYQQPDPAATPIGGVTSMDATATAEAAGE